ncbi:MAG: VOC family protein, partial [Phycisphaerales bacterium]|nr:VOC family protein [Phycisphaerales bacterium]
MTTLSPASRPSTSTDPLQLVDVDHVRFYVGNAKQAAYFYCHCFGFTCEQVSDQTTGSRDAAHYYLTQGNIRFVLTSGLTKDHPASRHVALYGDGVKDVAFTVLDAEAAFKRSLDLVAKKYISEAAHDAAVARHNKAKAVMNSLQASVA